MDIYLMFLFVSLLACFINTQLIQLGLDLDAVVCDRITVI